MSTGIVAGDVEIGIKGDAILPLLVGSVVLLNDISYKIVKDTQTGRSGTNDETHKFLLVREAA